jgi:hypothetical protein
LRPSSIGPSGDGDISSVLANVTGASAHGADLNPGCSIRLLGGMRLPLLHSMQQCLAPITACLRPGYA